MSAPWLMVLASFLFGLAATLLRSVAPTKS